jgi:hypothetical protein
LQTIFGSIIPASRIAHKEIPDQQARGVDVLALEALDAAVPTLVIAEVKGSVQAKSPPAVVAGMVSKLKSISSNRRLVIAELTWMRDNCEDDYAQECMTLCCRYLLGKVEPDMVLTPILLRTASTSADTDRGEFRSSPDSFDHPIRWISVVVDVEDLFDLARHVYAAARKLSPT